MNLYICNELLDFSFVCNRKLKKQKIIEKNYNDKNVIIQITHLRDGSNKVSINCWLNRELLFCQYVPYIKNQKYSIFCRFDKIKKHKYCTYTHDMLTQKRTYEEGYYCMKEIHPKEAKKIFKKLKKENLVSKPVLDHWDKLYDWKCKACNYSWVGNPGVGYVYKKNIYYNIPQRVMFSSKQPGYFNYNGKTYQGIPYKNYFVLKWFNKKEYEEKAKWYYEHGCIIEKDGTINQEMLKNWKEDWIPFEEYWKKYSCYQHEIDDNGNILAGAWRDLKTGEIVAKLVKDINCEWEVHVDESKYEKVITKGWHHVKTDGAIKCPVCDMLSKIICYSGYRPLNLIQKLRERVTWKVDGLKRRFNNLKYDLKRLTF